MQTADPAGNLTKSEEELLGVHGEEAKAAAHKEGEGEEVGKHSAAVLLPFAFLSYRCPACESGPVDRRTLSGSQAGSRERPGIEVVGEEWRRFLTIPGPAEVKL